ncbi:MAG: patatin-like phospholipase family protein [Senegalimassilia anaerobia]
MHTGNACGREFAFHEVPEKLDPFDFQAFANSPITLTAVSSDLELGEADYHAVRDLGRDADLPYLIASSSMPLVSQIVEVDGKKLLDGGTCDSVPITYSLLTGRKKHIVVLTQDATYEKGANKLMPVLWQESTPTSRTILSACAIAMSSTTAPTAKWRACTRRAGGVRHTASAPR